MEILKGIILFAALIGHVVFCSKANEGVADHSMRASLEACAKKNNISVIELTSWQVHIPKNIPQNLKCGIRCCMETTGVIGKDGYFNATVFKDRFGFVDKDTLASMTDKFEKLNEKDPCEYAFKIRSTMLGIKA